MTNNMIIKGINDEVRRMKEKSLDGNLESLTPHSFHPLFPLFFSFSLLPSFFSLYLSLFLSLPVLLLILFVELWSWKSTKVLLLPPSSLFLSFSLSYTHIHMHVFMYVCVFRKRDRCKWQLWFSLCSLDFMFCCDSKSPMFLFFMLFICIVFVL